MIQESAIIETQFRQRAYDGMWEKVVKIMDHENTYSYTTESGYRVTLIPEKWITAGVFDLNVEIID